MNAVKATDYVLQHAEKVGCYDLGLEYITESESRNRRYWKQFKHRSEIRRDLNLYFKVYPLIEQMVAEYAGVNLKLN